MYLTIILKFVWGEKHIVRVNKHDVIDHSIKSIFKFPNSVQLLIGCKGREILSYLTFQEQNIKTADVLILSFKKEVPKGRKEQFLQIYYDRTCYNHISKSYLDRIREISHIFDTTFLSLETSPKMIPVFRNLFISQGKMIQKYKKKTEIFPLNLTPAPKIMEDPLPNPFIESYPTFWRKNRWKSHSASVLHEIEKDYLV